MFGDPRTACACIAAGQQFYQGTANGIQPFLPHLSLISAICHLFLQTQILFSGELSTSTEVQVWILGRGGNYPRRLVQYQVMHIPNRHSHL